MFIELLQATKISNTSPVPGMQQTAEESQWEKKMAFFYDWRESERLSPASNPTTGNMLHSLLSKEDLLNCTDLLWRQLKTQRQA